MKFLQLEYNKLWTRNDIEIKKIFAHSIWYTELPVVFFVIINFFMLHTYQAKTMSTIQNNLAIHGSTTLRIRFSSYNFCPG